MIKHDFLSPFKGITLKPIKKIFLLLLITPLFWKCISPPDYMGYDLIPSQDFLNTRTDTSFTISAFTLLEDTVKTNGFSDAVVGAIYDEVYGKTRASVLSSVQIGTTNPDFGENPQIDSVHLLLTFKDYYGEESTPLKIFVHELTDTIHNDSVYNALAPLSAIYNPDPIGSVTYTGGSTLKIPISNEWAQKFIDADSATLATQKEFEKFFNGIYITTNHLTSYGKSVYTFNWNSSFNRIVIYYNKIIEEDSLVNTTYNMQLNSFCKRYLHFEHDYTAASPAFKINYLNDTLVQDSVFYVQGLGGVKGMLRLDDVKSWIDSMPIAIHRAELIVERELYEGLPPDTLITTLSLYHNVNEVETTIDDYQLDSGVGGKYNRVKNQYSFNITLHLQKLLNGDYDSDKLFIKSDSYLKPNRTVLRSGNHSGKIKLIITYAKL